MPRLRPAIRVGLGTFALVAGMAWIPGTATAAAANITITSAGPDGSGNPYDLTVVANDGDGQAITSMTAHLAQGSVNVSVPMQPVSISNPASQTWVATTPVPAVSLPAGRYTVTVDATDATESDPGLAAPNPLVVTYSATTVNVTPSATFVTVGAQTVKFTGTVTGTARDGSGTQVPIGGVTLNVSDGDKTTASPTGAINYTSPSLSQSTSFDFSLPAASDGSYPSGDSGAIQISAQQATTSISVTGSPANISQGAEQVTFSGQVTATPAGGGQAVPISGATVNVYNGATLIGQTSPTAADGSFSYGPATVSSATDFTFGVTPTNLYGPATKDVSIGTAQASTKVSIAPSQTFVTQGANNVTFTGQVTVTPPGGGAAAPIGSGVSVQVSAPGQATVTETTDASGDFSYTANGLTAASTSFTFSVAAGALYTAATQVTTIVAQAATTTVSVTPSQGSIELGAQKVGFSGQVTITAPGSPSPQGIGANIPVTVTGGSVSTTVLTTDASGDFTVPSTTLSSGTSFAFSVAGTNLYSSGTNQVQIVADAPATTSIAMTASGVITFGSPGTTLTGSVTALNATSATVPVPNAAVFLNGGSTPVATTNASGQFSYPVPGPPGNPTFTFSVNQDANPNPLYTAASTQITVAVTPGQTNVAVQTSPATVNGGPQTVTFTVTVDVTPAGTGATALPIGSGIPVDVTKDGNAASTTLAGTSNASGVVTYVVPGVQPGDDYNFAVAGSTLYTAGNADVAFNKESTNVAVTPSQTSVTKGAQSVTFTGTVTGVVGTSSVPIGSVPISLNGSAAPVATTDASGDFSYTAAGISHAGTYQFSVAGTDTYTAGSESVAIGLTAAATRISYIKVSSGLKYGQQASLRAAVQYKSGKSWVGFPGARVFLSEGKVTLGSVVASKTGTFTAKLPTTHGSAWLAQVNAAALTQQATAAGNLTIAMPLRVGTFSAGLWTDGAVHSSGCLIVTAPVRFGPMSSVQIQYETSTRGPWHLLGKLALHNYDKKAKGCANPNESYFSGAIRAASDNAYYRAVFAATSSFQGTVSKVIHSSRYQTRITGYAVSPHTLKKGQQVTVTGRLWRKVGSTWKPYGGRTIEIVYNEKGTSFWSNLGSVKTSSNGDFKQVAYGGGGNFIAIIYAEYSGSSTDLAVRSTGVPVTIKQGGSAGVRTTPGGARQLSVMITVSGAQTTMLSEQNMLILGLAPEEISL
jgi:hypothetical protein